jgi:hypothetical protein
MSMASSKTMTPHPLTARRVCAPPPLVRGEDKLAGWRGGGGSIFWKTPDTALYSTYVSTLWLYPSGNFSSLKYLMTTFPLVLLLQ